MDVYSLRMNLIATVFVAALVFLLPLTDRRICRRLKLNLSGGLSENPDADRLLRLRQRLLAFGVLLYLLIFAWLVFFSRGSSGDYNVHVAPLEDLKNAFSTPTGFSGWFRTLFREGVSSAFSQISIVRPEDISQFYLNVILFVPIGYLLPYAFRWFRDRVRVRPVLFCLQMLYIAAGYVVTHPGWRKDLREYRRWKSRARSSALYPYTKNTGMFRTTLRGSDQAAVCDFYMNRLGFRLRQELNRRESGDVVFLFEMGRTQVQVICSFREALPEKQYLTMYATHLPALRRRLVMKGINPGDYRRDPCTGRRMLRFNGPDNVCVEIMESD